MFFNVKYLAIYFHNAFSVFNLEWNSNTIPKRGLSYEKIEYVDWLFFPGNFQSNLIA